LIDVLQRHAGLAHDDPRRRIVTLAKPLGRVVSPLALTPRVPYEERFIFAGLADRLVNPRNQVTRRVQCRNWAIRGGTVCRLHGGAAPQVLVAAAKRLDREQDAADHRDIMRRLRGDFATPIPNRPAPQQNPQDAHPDANAGQPAANAAKAAPTSAPTKP
jgi:hypothetical protein